MTWWCAATDLPWAWTWRAYPGVWLFLGLVVIGLARVTRPAPGQTRRGTWYWAVGVGILWVALDWPLGALGGYLASAHAGQFILIALAAPPLILLGIRDGLGSLPAHRWPARVLSWAARPVGAFVGYNLVVILTHVPSIVDGMMASQLGSFGLDLLWLGAGLWLWWPVTAPEPYRRLTPPLQIVYLFVQTLPATFPASFLVFADYPLYRLYELAPRVTALLTPQYDHQVAGLLMKIVGDPVVWIGIAIIFFRWANRERRADLASGLGRRHSPV